MNVTALPTRNNIDALWERYATMARASAENPRLLSDLNHCQALAGAWADWRDAYLRWGRK